MEGLAGPPYPLGATWDGEGVNFAIFSAHAEKIELCLFDRSGAHEEARIVLPEYTDEVWHAYLPDARPEPALRLSGLRPLRSVERASVQSEQAADRPLRQGPAGPASLGRCGFRLSPWQSAGGSVV